MWLLLIGQTFRFCWPRDIYWSESSFSLVALLKRLQYSFSTNKVTS